MTVASLFIEVVSKPQIRSEGKAQTDEKKDPAE
jgi:hypothetical protein